MRINSFVQNHRTFSMFSKQITAACYQSHQNRSSINPLTNNTTLVSNRIQILYCSNSSEDKNLNSKVNLVSETTDDPKLAALRKIFQCTHTEAVEVLEFLSDLHHDDVHKIDLSAINKKVRWLRRCGATLPIIMKNCHLLLLPIGEYNFFFLNKQISHGDFLNILYFN